MNITFKQKVAVATCSILGLGGLGVGTALAQASPKSTPAEQAPDTDTDTAQQGDQTTPDTAEAAGEKADAPEANGDNHQDADGANVDFTPPGESPEAG